MDGIMHKWASPHFDDFEVQDKTNKYKLTQKREYKYPDSLDVYNYINIQQLLKVESFPFENKSLKGPKGFHVFHVLIFGPVSVFSDGQIRDTIIWTYNNNSGNIYFYST